MDLFLFWGVMGFMLVAGFFAGKWQNQDYRLDVMRLLSLKAQLLAQRIEVKTTRDAFVNSGHGSKQKSPAKRQLKRIRPCFSKIHKVFLALLYRVIPDSIAYLVIRPKTVIGWSKNLIHLLVKIKTKKQKSNRGRPSVPPHIVDAIITCKTENPSYGKQKIANIINKQLGEAIHKNTVERILTKNGFAPQPPGKKPRRSQDPTWKTALTNQFACSMDIKTTYTIALKKLYILNIIDHNRRKLIWSAATYSPTFFWISQQLREAFPYETAPRYMIMDRDSLFIPIVHKTLPSMGVIPCQTGIKCPWQNGIVERFHRTLQEELLDYVLPLGMGHMNHLLQEYKLFYNTARPHMDNDGEPPLITAEHARPGEIIRIGYGSHKLESVSWLNGLHHSYRWAA